MLVPPAIRAIMSSPSNRVNAFVVAGHVSSVMGTWQYPPLAAEFRVPIVVTGFEPLDLLEGIRRTVIQLEAGRHELENAYPRVVTERGNEAVQAVIAEVFTATDRAWRGIGVIPESGWRQADAYATFDAEQRFDLGSVTAEEAPLCKSGEVLKGMIRPNEYPTFGRECAPRMPLGGTMVSGEGACAAWYHARPTAHETRLA